MHPFTLNVLNMNTYEQSAMDRFWHDDTKATLAHWIMERTQSCVNMRLMEYLCFLTK